MNTNPSRSSSLSCQYFSTSVFSLQVDPIISTSVRSPLGFPNGVRSICPTCLCFPTLPPLFLQGLGFLNQVSILWMWSLSILIRQCSYLVILRKMLTEFQVRHSSLIFFSGGFNSSFVDHILFLVSMFFHAGAPHNHSPLAIHLFWSAEDISEYNTWSSVRICMRITG